MPNTLIEQRRREWAEHLLQGLAQTMLDETIAVRFVDDATLGQNAVALYRPATGLRVARIELAKSLLAGDGHELMTSFFHEVIHGQQRKMPRHRRKSWYDEEVDAEIMGQRLAHKTARACRKQGIDLRTMLTYPDDRN